MDFLDMMCLFSFPSSVLIYMLFFWRPEASGQQTSSRRIGHSLTHPLEVRAQPSLIMKRCIEKMGISFLLLFQS